jgi:hypothetical protein
VGLSKLATAFDREGDKLYHNISTLQGNSGSPITRLKKLKGSQKQVVSAIHQGTADFKTEKLNLGLIISPEVVKSLAIWRMEMEKGFKITSTAGESSIYQWLLKQEIKAKEAIITDQQAAIADLEDKYQLAKQRIQNMQGEIDNLQKKPFPKVILPKLMTFQWDPSTKWAKEYY